MFVFCIIIIIIIKENLKRENISSLVLDFYGTLINVIFFFTYYYFYWYYYY